MRTIIIILREGNRKYSETISGCEYREVQEHFCECQTNGANPHLENMTFEEFTRPLEPFKSTRSGLEQYNGNHYIYGWMECFSQSDEVPFWIQESTELTIEVKENNTERKESSG